jgi:hypothetical protein
MTIQLQPGETILKEGGASHAKGIETVGGHLWLTNLRLFFQSHAINIQLHAESFPLQEITFIQPHGVVPTWMYVTLRNGRREKFVVFGREEWISRITGALKQIPTANIPVQVAPNEPATKSDLVHPPSSTPGFTPQPGYTTPVNAVLHPLKNRSNALVLEILLGLFGLFGIGWMYSGNTTVGILLLTGVMIWNCIALSSIILTGGFACICTIPVNLILVAISATLLNSYIKRHPELFRI